MFSLENRTPKVLVIEDNLETARIEIQTAESMGFEVKHIADGSIAIQEIKNYKPNIIILDLELPGQNGVQIQQDMMEDLELRDIPVIVASVHLDAQQDSKELGRSYERVYARATGKRPVRTVMNSSTHDLIIELTATCGELYDKLPSKLMDHWMKTAPGEVRMLGVL